MLPVEITTETRMSPFVTFIGPFRIVVTVIPVVQAGILEIFNKLDWDLGMLND